MAREYERKQVAFTPHDAMDGFRWRRTNRADRECLWCGLAYTVVALCTVLPSVHVYFSIVNVFDVTPS